MPAPNGSIKETLESVVVAFILALTVRAYVVEAFVIPTGSMAPTLLGQHARLACPQCGYDLTLDANSRPAATDVPRTGNRAPRCPMCRFPLPLRADTPLHNGDRILVQKYRYLLHAPRRWDVTVFKNPQEPFGPQSNYIKRLVGLPHEDLLILDGNLYTRDAAGRPPQTADDADRALSATEPLDLTGFTIASKVDPAQNANWEAIQRAVWQPVYHSRFAPLDGGTGSDRLPQQTWAYPWDVAAGSADVRGDGRIDVDATAEPATLRFNFFPIVPGILDGLRRIDGPGDDRTRYPYNQTFGSGSDQEMIEDLRLAVTVTPHKLGDRASITLRTHARLDGAVRPIQVRFGDVGADEPAGVEGLLHLPVRDVGFEPGGATTVELWQVDQTLLIWVDDALVHRQPLRPMPRGTTDDPLVDLPPPPTLDEQDIRITVRGMSATLADLQLDRDLHFGDGGPFPVAGGVPRHPGTGRILRHQVRPVRLDADEYFLVGDNGPSSKDSRLWRETHPWVERRFFDGRGPRLGRVPRDLILGQAFFVYYPAPLSIQPGGPPLVPNFAEMRVIR